MKRKVILDTEMNKLHNPTRVWCTVLIDVDTEEVFKFRPNSPMGYHEDWQEEFLDFVNREVEFFVGHNLIGYDAPNLNRLLKVDVLRPENLEDTLVMSRLANPTRIGGHSLENWGRILGLPKIEFNDFSKFTEEQLDYCVRDCQLNLLVYKQVCHELETFSQECVDLEHGVAFCLSEQERNGFKLDFDKAKKLFDDTRSKLDEMDVQLQELFPPVFKVVRDFEFKYKKDGTPSTVSERILKNYQETEGYKAELIGENLYRLSIKETFNPQSSKQVAERMLSLGWKPKKYTDKGNIKTDKETIAEAINDLLSVNPDLNAVKALAKYNIVADRHQKASKWIELSRLEDYDFDGRVHGKVNPIGAGTHRCSHYDDNMANIARVVTKSIPVETFTKVADPSTLSKFEPVNDDFIFLHLNKGKQEVDVAVRGLLGNYGWDSRDCWTVSDKRTQVLVGADAAGIQLRALAHYMRDPDYTKALLEGDIHTVHQIAAGIETRNKAKTFIYAWLLGAGDEKIGTIVGVKSEEIEELITYAKNIKKWGKTLLEIIISGLREKRRKADKLTVCTIIKGYKTKEQFLNRTPALKHLRKVEIPKAAKQGYLVGLDGRKLWIPNEHLAMSLYLQGFEAVIMKKAMVLFNEKLKANNVPYKQVAMVHDEFQVETHKDYGDFVGQTIVESIKIAGELLNSSCPLDGEYKIGTSWAETH